MRKYDSYARAKYQIILDFLKTKKNLKILNAGFGSGELSFLLSREGHSTTNLEPVQSYIELAKQNANRLNIQNCTFVQSSIENYNPSNLYDCVITTDVIEHIKDDNATVKKLLTFLKKDGLLITIVPALPILFGYHDLALNHYRRYTKSTLKNIVPSTKILKLRYFGFFLIPITILYSKILKKYYPVQTVNQNVVLKILTFLILEIEKKISFPVGTSLIMFAKKY